MKVKKTVHQLVEEVLELRKTREVYAIGLSRNVIEDKKPSTAEYYQAHFEHTEEVLKFLSNIEVEYEDPYQEEEEEE